MNLVSAMVGISMATTAMPMVADMVIQPVIAQRRAMNFAAAETAAVTFATLAQDKYTVPEDQLADICSVELIEERTYNVTCTQGEGEFKGQAVRAFSLLDEVANSLTVTTDDDLNGFDDTTGMPTHYFQCYSGWTGVGTLKNNCELGGPYVIPAYRHLYD